MAVREGAEELPQPSCDKLIREGDGYVTKKEGAPRIFFPLTVVGRAESMDGSVLDVTQDAALQALQAHFKTEVMAVKCAAPKPVTTWTATLRTPEDGSIPVKVGEMVKLPAVKARWTPISLEATSNDACESRRKSIQRLFNDLPATCDGIVVELPQCWLVPDPDFKAKHAFMPVFPQSLWVKFFKSFGDMKKAEISFHTATNTPGAMNGDVVVHLLVNFKTRDAAVQCVLHLYDRWLQDPKTQDRRACGIRPINYDAFKADSDSARSQAPPAATPGAAKTTQLQPPAAAPRPVAAKAKAKPSPAIPTAASLGTGGAEMAPISVDELQQILKRMERLERENQELMEMLVEIQKEGRGAKRARTDAGPDRPSPPAGDGSAPPWRLGRAAGQQAKADQAKAEDGETPPWRAAGRAAAGGSPKEDDDEPPPWRSTAAAAESPEATKEGSGEADDDDPPPWRTAAGAAEDAKADVDDDAPPWRVGKAT